MFTTMAVYYTDQFADADAGYYQVKGTMLEWPARVLNECRGIHLGQEWATYREVWDKDVDAASRLAHW